jgi:hypothetical protein
MKKLLKETQEKTNNEAHGCDYKLINEKEFFDAHEILPVYHGGVFDCLDESDFEIYEGRDLLCMNAIYKYCISIDCTHVTCGTLLTQDPEDIYSTESPVPVLEANLTPSDIDLSLLVEETILCPVANHAGRKWLLAVIFDTGASLSITHDLGDLSSRRNRWPDRCGWEDLQMARKSKVSELLCGHLQEKMVWKYNSLWKHTMFQPQSKDCCLLKHFCAKKREYLDPTLEMRRSLS